MRRVGRDGSDGKQRDGSPQRPPRRERGAWYADPYGIAAERWWDGGKWTQEVRGGSQNGIAPTRRRTPRVARSASVPRVATSVVPEEKPPEEKPPEVKPPEVKPPEEDDPALYDDATAFPVRLDTSAARELRVAANGSRSSALSSFPRFYGSYELGTDSGRAGTIKLGVRSTLARMASAEGAWVLRKRPRLGWELGMETADGDAAGLYSGRHWGGGGTISLANGMRADLRRSRYRRWRVRALETQEPLLEIRTAPIPTALTIATGRRSSLRSPDLDLLVLTACTVLILDAMWGPAGRESADGFVSS